MSSKTEEVTFKLNLILINLELSSRVWLLTTVLDSTDLFNMTFPHDIGILIARMELLYLYFDHNMIMDFSGGSDGKESTCNAGDLASVLGLRRSRGGGYGNPLQYSCLENPMDRGVWWATVHAVTQSRTRLKQQHRENKRMYLKE